MSDEKDPPLEMIRKSFPPGVHNIWFKQENGTQPLSVLGTYSPVTLMPWSGSTTIYFTRLLTKDVLIKAEKSNEYRVDSMKKLIYEGIPEVMLQRIVRHDITQNVKDMVLEVQFQATVPTEQLEEFAHEFVKQTWGIYADTFDELLEKELK